MTTTPTANNSATTACYRLPSVQTLIDLAIEEDLGAGDITTSAALRGHDSSINAVMVARSSLVVAGLPVASQVFHRVDPSVEICAVLGDGVEVAAGEPLMRLAGSAIAILQAERVALNFAQRLCGVATLARQFSRSVAGTAARVVDTRKTTPGYRVLEKAAVRAGGCFNHRFDLGSGVLIKDNHIAACGSLGETVARARVHAPHGMRIEVEVDTLAQLDEALEAGADIVLLDNMSVDQVEIAAERAHERGALVEVSGGITLETVSSYARVGADIISAGALTHSAAAVDIALDVAGA